MISPVVTVFTGLESLFKFSAPGHGAYLLSFSPSPVWKMKLLFSLTALLLVAATTLVSGTEDIQRYQNYSVYRLKPNNVFQLAMLHDLQEEDGVDFWREADQVNRIADVMLSPEAKGKVLPKLDELGINYEVIISDVEQ